MAPNPKAKSATAGAKDPNPKQTIKFKLKLYIDTSENDSKNTKRCRHCGTSVRRRSGLPAEDVELEVADSVFRSRWASMSLDELVAAITMVQMKNDPNYSAPVQKKTRSPRRNLTRQGRRS